MLKRLLIFMLTLAPASLAAQNAAGPVSTTQATVVAQSSSVLPLVEPDAKLLPSKVTWNDEFDGPKLDSTKWPRNGTFRFPGYPSEETLAGSNGETERYDPSKVLWDYPGYVHLRIERDYGAGHVAWGKRVLPNVGKAPYSGMGLPQLFGVTDLAGMIHTYPTYPYLPGSMIEARVYLPTNCKGRWPAFWSFNYPNPNTPNPNASFPFAGQEDDMFEANGVGHLKITLHNGMSTIPSVEVTHPSGWIVVRQWRDQKNQKVYEWINDKLVMVAPAGNLNDLALPVMLNVAGGTPNWAFIGLPDASTPVSCEMLVDYVRIKS